MKTPAFCCFPLGVAAALGLLANTVSSQGKAGCIDSICIAAPISSLPKDTPWLALNPQTLRSHFTPNSNDVGERPFAAKRVADGATFAKKIFPAQAIDYAVLGNSMGLQTGGFDARLLPLLNRLTVACKPFTWTGSYSNARGELTEVVLMLYPPSANEPNAMRVQRITRYLPAVALGLEMQALRESLQALIAMPVNEKHNDKSRKDTDLSPIANLSRSAARGDAPATAVLEINDMPVGRFDLRQFDQQAACKL